MNSQTFRHHAVQSSRNPSKTFFQGRYDSDDEDCNDAQSIRSNTTPGVSFSDIMGCVTVPRQGGYECDLIDNNYVKNSSTHLPSMQAHQYQTDGKENYRNNSNKYSQGSYNHGLGGKPSYSAAKVNPTPAYEAQKPPFDYRQTIQSNKNNMLGGSNQENESTTVVAICKRRQLYSKHHIDPYKEVTEAKVKAAFADHHHNNKQLVSQMTADLRNLKSSVMKWGRSNIQAFMLQAAKSVQLQYRNEVVKKFTDIGSAYASGDPTEDKHNQMLWILYGSFKTKRGWANDMEQRYMEEHNAGYTSQELTEQKRETKGFIECIFTIQYNELKRSITERAKKSHGQYIQLRNNPKMKSDNVNEVEHENDVEEVQHLNAFVFNNKMIKSVGGPRSMRPTYTKSITVAEFDEYQKMKRDAVSANEEINDNLETINELESMIAKYVNRNNDLEDALVENGIAIPDFELQTTNSKDMYSHSESGMYSYQRNTRNSAADSYCTRHDDIAFSLDSRNQDVARAASEYSMSPQQQHYYDSYDSRSTGHDFIPMRMTHPAINQVAATLENFPTIPVDTNDEDCQTIRKTLHTMSSDRSQQRTTSTVSLTIALPPPTAKSVMIAAPVTKTANAKACRSKASKELVADYAGKEVSTKQKAQSFKDLKKQQETERQQAKSKQSYCMAQDKVMDSSTALAPTVELNTTTALNVETITANAAPTAKKKKTYVTTQKKRRCTTPKNSASHVVATADIDITKAVTTAVTTQNKKRTATPKNSASNVAAAVDIGVTKAMTAAVTTQNKKGTATPKISVPKVAANNAAPTTAPTQMAPDHLLPLAMSTTAQAARIELSENVDNSCKHQDYILDVSYYEISIPQELDYALKEASACALCNTEFGYKKTQIKPSKKHPIYACMEMRQAKLTKPCNHAVCGKCFAAEMMKEVTNKPMGRKRKLLNKDDF